MNANNIFATLFWKFCGGLDIQKFRNSKVNEVIENLAKKGPFESFLLSIFEIFLSQRNIFIFTVSIILLSTLVYYLNTHKKETEFKKYNYIVLMGIGLKIFLMLLACGLITSELKSNKLNPEDLKSLSPFDFYNPIILFFEFFIIFILTNLIFKENLLKNKYFYYVKNVFDAFLFLLLLFTIHDDRLNMLIIVLAMAYLYVSVFIPAQFYLFYNLILNIYNKLFKNAENNSNPILVKYMTKTIQKIDNETIRVMSRTIYIL